MDLLRIGLCFNLRSSGLPGSASARDGPEDAQAEYDSWSTVSALAEALSFHGSCRVITLPFGPDLPHLLAATRPDVVFNIAEGEWGRSRESLAPAVLELLGVPYVGSDPVALGVAMDKALAKAVVAGSGVAVARGARVEVGEDAVEAAGLVPLPAFVKPVAEGSSKGVRRGSRVNTLDEMVRQVQWVHRWYGQAALVEEYLPGREFSVGLVGNGAPFALPVLEVRPLMPTPEGTFVYCYHTKSGNLEQYLCPAPITPQLSEQLVGAARTVFRALGLRDMARVDFRLGADGTYRFLEVNPLPGLSATSLFTAQAAAAGLDLSELVARIVHSACIRWLDDPRLSPRLRDRLAALVGTLEPGDGTFGAPAKESGQRVYPDLLVSERLEEG
mgnify:CR=1 FL=1